MGKGIERDLGFDLEHAVTVLHQKALAAGAVAPDDFRAKDPYSVAWAHLSLHGIQATGPRCYQRPCRLGGICFALYEIATYQIEFETIGSLAGATERFVTHVRSAATAYAPALAQLEMHMRQRHELESSASLEKPLHAHDLLCRTPQELETTIKQLDLTGSRFAAELREMVQSNELAQSSHRRRRTLLLTAVYQHLAWGGWTYPEIAELIPATALGPEGAADRVRKRVKDTDARSLHPFEDFPEPAEESPQVDSSR